MADEGGVQHGAPGAARAAHQDGTGNPSADYSIDEIVPNYSASASVDYMPGGRAYLSARTGYFFRDAYNQGVYQGDRYIYRTSSQNLSGSPADQHPLGFTNVPSNVSRDRARGPHYSFQVDGTVTFAAAGRHQMKGGVQFDRVGIDALTGATGNVINLFWGQRFTGVQGRYGYYTVGSNDVAPNRGLIIAGRATVNNVGLFLQDEWALGSRLTLHAGLRTENEHVPSLSNDPSIPRTAIHFGFGDKLAPRLGLAWDATGDRKTKVFGSWACSTTSPSCRSRRGSAGSGRRCSGTRWTARTSRRSWTTRPARPACPGTLIGSVSPIAPINDPAADGIDPALDQMRLQEIVIGAEREIAPAVALSARYMHKQLDRALEDVATQDAESEPFIRIANPGFGAASEFYPGDGLSPLALPRAVRDYDALEIALERRLAAAGPDASHTRGAGSRATTRVSRSRMRMAVSSRTSACPSITRCARSTSRAARCMACLRRIARTS